MSLYWLPSLVFIVHVMEELPRFPQWATRHFGVTSRAWFVYSHIVLIGSNFAIGAFAARSAGPDVWRLLATAVQVVLATNAVFHVVTTVLFREYSPGVVTAVLLFVPASVLLVTHTIDDALLAPSQLAVAVALGTVVGALVVASLWLRMDIDWRLRRMSAPPSPA